eukprot:scaffold2107_cov222-Pinguiococcus_pyrenoidosus.AAC.2
MRERATSLSAYSFRQLAYQHRIQCSRAEQVQRDDRLQKLQEANLRRWHTPEHVANEANESAPAVFVSPDSLRPLPRAFDAPEDPGLEEGHVLEEPFPLRLRQRHH